MEELDATFKEDASVYFDENPHDGLHDTHDVNDSLKDKVKRLVFVPIISRTYCDPKSFAWEKEFLPFLEFARNDEHGLKVKLANGNVTSRVLPVRIHDQEKDIFEIQEKIARSVVNLVALELNGTEQKIIKSYTEDVEAYNEYLQGQFFFNKRSTGVLSRFIGTKPPKRLFFEAKGLEKQSKFVRICP